MFQVMSRPTLMLSFVVSIAWEMTAPRVLWAMPPQYEITKNENLKEQFAGSPERLLPQGRNWSLGGDLQMFEYPDPLGAYYHGGYWLNTYAEYLPHPEVSFNLKLVFFNPSVSYGYNAPARLLPFFSAAWNPRAILGLNPRIQAGDLGRRTLGAGLLVQEKEISGAMVQLRSGLFSLEVTRPGTSIFEHFGDSHFARLCALDGLAELVWLRSYLSSRYARLVPKSFKRTPWDAQFWSLSSRYKSSWGIGYALEVARRGESNAFLGRVTFDLENDWAAAVAEVGGREYARDFWHSIARQIDQDYASLEDRSKRYTTGFNFLAWGNPSRSYEAVLTTEVLRTSPIRLRLRNELGRVQFHDRKSLSYYMYDNGISICPISLPSACGTISLSNIEANVQSGADGLQLGSQPIHKKLHKLRLEGRMVF